MVSYHKNYCNSEIGIENTKLLTSVILGKILSAYALVGILSISVVSFTNAGSQILVLKYILSSTESSIYDVNYLAAKPTNIPIQKRTK